MSSQNFAKGFKLAVASFDDDGLNYVSPSVGAMLGGRKKEYSRLDHILYKGARLGPYRIDNENLVLWVC